MSVESLKKVLGDNRADGNAVTLLGEQVAGQHFIAVVVNRKKSDPNLQVIADFHERSCPSRLPKGTLKCPRRSALDMGASQGFGGVINQPPQSGVVLLVISQVWFASHEALL